MAVEAVQHKQPVKVPGLPLIGNMVDFARDPVAFIAAMQREYGDYAEFSLLGKPAVLISHPDDIDRVMLETGKRYGKFKPTFALRIILGNGLVASEGDLWKRQRKLMAPAFHHQSIKQYTDLIVNCGQEMAATWEDGSVRDVHQEMMLLTQRIIMKALFDVDVLTQSGEAGEAFDAMMKGIGAEMTGLDAVLPDFVPTRSRIHMKQGAATINAMLLDIIERRKHGGAAAPDLLTVLMDARDEDGQPMSTEQMLDEIRTLYLAGHETTATTLSWAWLLLSQNPDAYAKLEAEIADVLQGRAPTAEDVPKLTYANAVVKESLRCYPVAWVLQRVPLEEVELQGQRVPADTMIFFSPWVVHHDPRWYADPDAFRPERWLVDKAEQPPREAYIPFGGGPRVCIGNGLALMEATLLLATLLQRFHVAVLPEHPVGIAVTGTIRPKYGLNARLTAQPG